MASDEKVSKSRARYALQQASHRMPPKAERTLLDRARDLKGDVTTDELNKLLKPWT